MDLTVSEPGPIVPISDIQTLLSSDGGDVVNDFLRK